MGEADSAYAKEVHTGMAEDHEGAIRLRRACRDVYMGRYRPASGCAAMKGIFLGWLGRKERAQFAAISLEKKSSIEKTVAFNCSRLGATYPTEPTSIPQWTLQRWP